VKVRLGTPDRNPKKYTLLPYAADENDEEEFVPDYAGHTGVPLRDLEVEGFFGPNPMKTTSYGWVHFFIRKRD
jgi:hypothetical protein